MNSTTDRIREIADTLHADCDREEEGDALRKIADEIDAAVLAERARWCAALFIPPGSPVGTDEEIRMAVVPPEIADIIIRGAKSIERTGCEESVRALRDSEDGAGERHNAFVEAEAAIRARDRDGQNVIVREPTVVGVTRDGHPVTR